MTKKKKKKEKEGGTRRESGFFSFTFSLFHSKVKCGCICVLFNLRLDDFDLLPGPMDEKTKTKKQSCVSEWVESSLGVERSPDLSFLSASTLPILSTT